MLYKRVADSEFIFLNTWSIWYNLLENKNNNNYLLGILRADIFRT